MNQDRVFDGSRCLCSGAGFCQHLNMQTNESLWGFCQSANPEARQAISYLTPEWTPYEHKVMSFPFITIADLNRASRTILQKLGNTKISAVAGIPRSGIIPASIIACYLGVPLLSFDKDHEIVHLGKGARKLAEPNVKGRLLVVDDTCVNGIQMTKSKSHCPAGSLFAAPFCTTKGKGFVDLFGETLEAPYHFLEWNFFSSEPFIKKSLFDLDGVLCEDIPEDLVKNDKEYIKYIKNAPAIRSRCPMISPCKAIVTGRLEKYRKVTEQWLKKNNIRYSQLVMYKGSQKERDYRFTSTVAKYKADFLSQSAATIFVESDPKQAMKICEYTAGMNKKVLCPSSRKVYYGKRYERES